MKHEELYEAIFAATMREPGSYGFINGTKTPLMERMEEGFASASMVHGFMVWKKENGKLKSTTFDPHDYEDSFQKLIEYLKDEEE